MLPGNINRSTFSYSLDSYRFYMKLYDVKYNFINSYSSLLKFLFISSYILYIKKNKINVKIF